MIMMKCYTFECEPINVCLSLLYFLFNTNEVSYSKKKQFIDSNI